MRENDPRYGEKDYQASQQIGARSQQEDTIDIVEMVYMLLAHWWQIILAAVLCGVLTFAYTFYQVTPQYRTTAKMFLASTSSASTLLSLTDIQWATNTKSDYQELLKSRPLLESVIESLDLQRTSQDIARMITITNPDNTRILYVTVTSPYPDEAADIANELVNQARTYLPEIMKMDAPSFYESALVPVNKYSPSYSRNTLLGAVGGAALVCAVLIAGFLLNDRMVTPDDVVKYLGIQPLASIPEAEEENKSSKKKPAKEKKEQSKPEKDPGEQLEQMLKEQITEELPDDADLLEEDSLMEEAVLSEEEMPKTEDLGGEV